MSERRHKPGAYFNLGLSVLRVLEKICKVHTSSHLKMNDTGSSHGKLNSKTDSSRVGNFCVQKDGMVLNVFIKVFGFAKSFFQNFSNLFTT